MSANIAVTPSQITDIKIKINWYGVLSEVNSFFGKLQHNLLYRSKVALPILTLVLCFHLVGICGISDALQLHCLGQDGPVAFSSRVDCHCLYLHQWHWKDERGMLDPGNTMKDAGVHQRWRLHIVEFINQYAQKVGSKTLQFNWNHLFSYFSTRNKIKITNLFKLNIFTVVNLCKMHFMCHSEVHNFNSEHFPFDFVNSYCPLLVLIMQWISLLV